MNRKKLRFAILKQIDEGNLSTTMYEEMNVDHEIWVDEVRWLSREGFITKSVYADDTVYIFLNTRLTDKGEQYLHENSSLVKLYRISKEARSWVPFFKWTFKDASASFYFVNAATSYYFYAKETVIRILTAYPERKDVAKYAHVATLTKLEENDFNMNILRYMDTCVPEPQIPLTKITQDIYDADKEIEKHERELEKCSLIWLAR